MTEHNTQTDGPWTEEEATAFARTLVTIGKGLPPRQRDAFAAILTAAGAQEGSKEVQGFFFYNVFIFSVLRAAGEEIKGTTDLNKAMEGQQLYIPS